MGNVNHNTSERPKSLNRRTPLFLNHAKLQFARVPIVRFFCATARRSQFWVLFFFSGGCDTCWWVAETKGCVGMLTAAPTTAPTMATAAPVKTVRSTACDVEDVGIQVYAACTAVNAELDKGTPESTITSVYYRAMTQPQLDAAKLCTEVLFHRPCYVGHRPML